jgi:hypothetical protein
MRKSRFPYALEAKFCAMRCMRTRPRHHADGAYPLSRGVETETGRRLLPN